MSNLFGHGCDQKTSANLLVPGLLALPCRLGEFRHAPRHNEETKTIDPESRLLSTTDTSLVTFFCKWSLSYIPSYHGIINVFLHILTMYTCRSCRTRQWQDTTGTTGISWGVASAKLHPSGALPGTSEKQIRKQYTVGSLDVTWISWTWLQWLEYDVSTTAYHSNHQS